MLWRDKEGSKVKYSGFKLYNHLRKVSPHPSKATVLLEAGEDRDGVAGEVETTVGMM